MQFPYTDRSIYQNNPLDKVIAQLRFPTILKIDTDASALSQFQDRIRDIFPMYQEQREIVNEINIGFPIPFQQNGIPQISNQSTKRTHVFKSEDGNWIFSLANTSISLSTRTYTKWEVFREYFQNAKNAFVEIYNPIFISRIGLRYINIFCRSSLNISPDREWNHLIKPYYNGLLSEIQDSQLLSFQNVNEIALDQEKCTVKTMSTFVNKKDDGEKCLVIDNDYAKNIKTAVAQADSVLDYLNGESSRFIRWIISDELHQAMRPQNVE